MGNSSRSRCVQDGQEVSVIAGNNASSNVDGIGPSPFTSSNSAAAPAPSPADATAGSITGSQPNTQGWKFGDPICPVDRVSYTKRVAERINFDLNAIEKYIKVKVWTEDEKKKVSEGVAGIACNLHENYCLYEKVIEYAIGRPLGRIYSLNDDSSTELGSVDPIYTGF